MTDPDALEQQAHAALDMLQYVLYTDVTNQDTPRGSATAIAEPNFQEEE